MELVSVNVSLPVEVEYNNKIISTGIFKQPVSTTTISQLGLAGDQQVDLENHGGEHKAVYGFSAHHYDYWRTELNNPDLSYGQFGENLTISDLDEATLCIGDQIQIGNCVLEITQPRVPCFKLGIAIGRREMPKLFVKHGATGIYFRIIKTGEVISGMPVKQTYQHPKQLSVQTLFKAYFDKDFVNATDVMNIAANIVELSDEWHEKVITRV
ncbi:MAG: MOSC domain-containing protein [Methylophagaceae bacterium]